ncbi:uncharacterized protein SRT_01610 [Streptococcus troglodytae]|uniref:Uncharacterized protein n=1 Tax=Streptococcus troglodytae TaxID=1111760 RepID=A0A1L7LHC1_9STRE|nr:uncharacterized protein SRT_01610 [Streptococcus troglodytae]
MFLMFDLVVNLILLVIVIGGFVFLRFYADKKGKREYDERQLLMQKKAYTNAAWVVMAFNLVLAIWGEVMEKYISLSFAGTASLFLIVGVFVCSSILNDAYFTARKTKGSSMCMPLLLLFKFSLFIEIGVRAALVMTGIFI